MKILSVRPTTFLNSTTFGNFRKFSFKAGVAVVTIYSKTRNALSNPPNMKMNPFLAFCGPKTDSPPGHHLIIREISDLPPLLPNDHDGKHATPLTVSAT